MANKQQKLWTLFAICTAILATIVISYNLNSDFFGKLACIGRNCIEFSNKSSDTQLTLAVDFAIDSLVDMSAIKADPKTSYKVDYLRFKPKFKNQPGFEKTMDWKVEILDKNNKLVEYTGLAKKTLETNISSYSFDIMKKTLCEGKDRTAITITLDPANKVKEIDETNNVGSASIKCN